MYIERPRPSCVPSSERANTSEMSPSLMLSRASTPSTATHATEVTTAEPDVVRRRPHLACLPLDEDGWSRSEQIVGVVGVRGEYRRLVDDYGADEEVDA